MDDDAPQIHLDIKSANVLLIDRRGEKCVLADMVRHRAVEPRYLAPPGPGRQMRVGTAFRPPLGPRAENHPTQMRVSRARKVTWTRLTSLSVLSSALPRASPPRSKATATR